MATVQPFRGWRYDVGRVGALGDVVAPPYDVIDPALQDRLYAKNPNNVIRLELNRPEPGDTDESRYERAGRLIKDWQHEGILRQEADAALYVYEQRFAVEGREFTRRGFLGRVRLERFGEGKVYAHEETMSGPKADRLKLMHATGMNLSPVFGLYPDPGDAVAPLLDRAVGRNLPLEATDDLGVVNRFWPVTDARVIREIQGQLYDKPVFIADGHHRYETAVRYRDERAAQGALPEEAPANFVLMMLVSMADPGLRILPTHRLVSGLPNLTAMELRKALEPVFAFDTVGTGPTAAKNAWELIEADDQNLLGFGTTADSTWQVARLQEQESMARLAPDHSAAWHGLAVSRLHVLALDHLLAQAFKAKPTCRYVHLLKEVTDAVAAKECPLAALVPAATMDHVEEIAGGLEKMPPKSTYFYPKLLTGLVFHSVK
jgi:uncharacterized protein (DUF1015 family)